MKKKNILAGIVAATMIASSTFALSGCGNYDLADMHYTFHYAVLEENGHKVLHRVKSWSDSESESVTISTECCCDGNGNYVWTSVNKANLYEKKPGKYAYEFECGHQPDEEQGTDPQQ